MLNRRHFSAALIGALAYPARVGAQDRRVQALRETAQQMTQLHALLVQQGDKVLVQMAPRGPGLERLANIKSCSKSLVGLLTGHAIASGAIAGVETRLAQIAPRLIPPDAAPEVSEITIQDLLTMRAGLASTSGPNYGAWVASKNWVEFALRQPIIAPPGEKMIYSTGTSHILGAALTVATGRSLLAQAQQVLAKPLGIEIPAWTRDPQGYFLGGNEMALTPAALLRLAVMLRDEGRYNKAQVIDPAWITASTQRQTFSDFSGLDYGYGWFLSDSGFVLARGYGGQIIAAHPAKGLAVAITSDPNLPARSEGHFGALLALLEGPILALTA